MDEWADFTDDEEDDDDDDENETKDGKCPESCRGAFRAWHRSIARD